MAHRQGKLVSLSAVIVEEDEDVYKGRVLNSESSVEFVKKYHGQSLVIGDFVRFNARKGDAQVRQLGRIFTIIRPKDFEIFSIYWAYVNTKNIATINLIAHTTKDKVFLYHPEFGKITDSNNLIDSSYSGLVLIKVEIRFLVWHCTETEIVAVKYIRSDEELECAENMIYSRSERNERKREAQRLERRNNYGLVVGISNRRLNIYWLKEQIVIEVTNFKIRIDELHTYIGSWISFVPWNHYMGYGPTERVENILPTRLQYGFVEIKVNPSELVMKNPEDDFCANESDPIWVRYDNGWVLPQEVSLTDRMTKLLMDDVDMRKRLKNRDKNLFDCVRAHYNSIM